MNRDITAHRRIFDPPPPSPRSSVLTQSGDAKKNGEFLFRIDFLPWFSFPNLQRGISPPTDRILPRRWRHSILSLYTKWRYKKNSEFLFRIDFYRDFHSPFFQLKWCGIPPQLATGDILAHRDKPPLLLPSTHPYPTPPHAHNYQGFCPLTYSSSI